MAGCRSRDLSSRAVQMVKIGLPTFERFCEPHVYFHRSLPFNAAFAIAEPESQAQHLRHSSTALVPLQSCVLEVELDGSPSRLVPDGSRAAQRNVC